MTTATVGDGKRGLQSIVMLVLLASSGLFYWAAIQAETSNPADVEMKTVVHKRNSRADVRCHFICQERRRLRVDKFNGVDILDPKRVLHAVLASKAKMVNNLKKDYGSYFDKIFVDQASMTNQMRGAASSSSAATATDSVRRSLQDQGDESMEVRYRGIDPITLPGESVNRLHRKLLLKLVTAQAELRKQESNLDGCDCIDGDRPISDELPKENTTEFLNIDSTYNQFVWATGGHSAAAGHGNLYNESYTAFLERAIKDVFGSIGIEFIGRNYAMGGTR
jgi:hypothetical protein